MRGAIALAVVLGVGCGDDGGDGGDVADASVPDSMSLPDAPPTGGATVTVNVFASGSPIPELPVAYARPDGTLVGTVLTDDNGQAMIGQFPVGGSVTAQGTPFTYADRPGGVLTTIFDVQDGDVLTFGANGPAPVVGTFRTQLPSSGSGGECVVFACGNATSSECVLDGDPPQLDAEVSEDCKTESGPGYDLVSYVVGKAGDRSEVSIAADATLSGEPTDIALDTLSTTLASVTTSYVSTAAASGRQQLIFGRDGAVVERVDVAATYPAASTTDLVREVASGFYDRVTYVTEAGDGASLSTLAESVSATPEDGSPLANSVSEADLLPVPDTAVVSEDGGTLTISVDDVSATTCTGSVGPDALRLRVRADLAGGSGPDFVEWLMITPVGTSFVSPELPEAFGTSWPVQDLSGYTVLVESLAHSELSWPDYRQASNLAETVGSSASRGSGPATACRSALGTIPE